ncbi:MAG: sulfotransferase [Actinobacteria bacterium]|nr:sulfotransferase [Actinomycetota bacterium]
MRSNRLFGARRFVWRVRRSGPRLARPLSAVLPAAPPPQDPILVLGCPRSGTGVLLEALLRSPDVRSVQSEGHILWDEFHHPRDRGWDSDALGESDVSEREREFVRLAIRWWARGQRFVDKTPASCLRIPYLEALLPGAIYVFLRRRAPDNVSSLMEAWKARPRFVKYRLPEPLSGLGPLNGNLWSLVLVPGWRELRSASLEEICAHQYIACNEAVLAARDRIEPSRWIEIAYEDLLADPVSELRRLYRQLGLEVVEKTREEVLARIPARTTLTDPEPEKWRRQNPEAVERILPLVAEVERRLGYEAVNLVGA